MKLTESFQVSPSVIDLNNYIYFKQNASFIQTLYYTYSYYSSCDGGFCSSVVQTIWKDVSQLWQNKL